MLHSESQHLFLGRGSHLYGKKLDPNPILMKMLNLDSIFYENADSGSNFFMEMLDQDQHKMQTYLPSSLGVYCRPGSKNFYENAGFGSV
jgi:hypothetical protein